MITLRCTKKLLQYLGVPRSDSDHPPTAALGDWYANLIPLFNSPPLILFVNERSLLSVVLPEDAAGDIAQHFRRRTLALLRRLDLPAQAVEREAFHIQQIVFGKTKSRRVLGTMNDAAFQVQALVEQKGTSHSLDQMEAALSEIPYSMIDYKYPVHVARELLGQTGHFSATPLPKSDRKNRGKKIEYDERVPIRFTTPERSLVIDHTFADPHITGPLEAARPDDDTITTTYTLDDIDELLGYIAAEANHTKDKKLRKELYRLYQRLRTVMESYDDGQWQNSP